MVDVAERIKKAREAAGLTQRELAKIIHLTQGYIGDIERGRTNPSLSTLQLVADALHVDIAAFVGNSTTIQETGLNNDEIDLVMSYRRLSEEQKALTKAMVCNFIPPKARFTTTSTINPVSRKRKSMGG